MPNDLSQARRRIQECKDNNSTNLALRYCGITDLDELADDLMGLDNLLELDLSLNYLTEIKNLESLMGLIRLDLAQMNSSRLRIWNPYWH